MIYMCSIDRFLQIDKHRNVIDQKNGHVEQSPGNFGESTVIDHTLFWIQGL